MRPSITFDLVFSTILDFFYLYCFQSHIKAQALLDSESMGTGVFRPDVNDPELSNADSSTVWELALLGTGHFHPTVRLVAHLVAEGAPSKVSGCLMMRM